MKRQPKNQTRPTRVIRLWNYPQTQKALPYFRSVVGSLRDHWLQFRSAERDLQRQAKQPGRPDRNALIANEHLQANKGVAENAFNEALHELMGMDVYLLDPVRGLAVVPFAKEEQLAWYVYDLFDPAGVAAWRFHEDPLDMRRPLAEALTPPKPTPTAA